MKGMIFAGCSFTWGQGLYYYSGLKTLREPPPNCFNEELLTDAHRRYAEIWRYPRLVASHFNTFGAVQKYNGGSEDTSIEYLEQVFNLNNRKYRTDYTYSFDEIDYIVLQTSQPHRNLYYYSRDGIQYEFSVDRPETKSKFYEWLFEVKRSSFEEWMKELIQIEFLKIRDTLQFYETKGIQTRVLCWENDYLHLFETDEWMKERFIPLYFNGVRYECIRDLMTEKKHLTIDSDFDNFPVTPKDHHPSLECHRIIANSIIKRIEEDEKILNRKPLVYGQKRII